MKFVTFNIRTESMVDGVNRFFYRKGFIMDKIEQEKPDIIGFQELRQPMHEYMRDHLNRLGYELLGCGRGKDYRDEHNPVAFLRDRFEAITLDVTWLSDTPNLPGSRYEVQSSCPRIITHLMLSDLTTDKPFHVYNTHLDHQQASARLKGAKLLMDKIVRENADYPFPVVLSGDFNAYPDAEETEFIRAHEFGFTELTRGIGTTWHDWGRLTPPQIDYIFVKGFESTGEYKKWDDQLNGIYLSDHYPIEVEIERQKEAE